MQNPWNAKSLECKILGMQNPWNCDSQKNEGWLAFGSPNSSLERNKEGEEEEEEDLLELQGLFFILGTRGQSLECRVTRKRMKGG
jgi:hypothetical protein